MKKTVASLSHISAGINQGRSSDTEVIFHLEMYFVFLINVGTQASILSHWLNRENITIAPNDTVSSEGAGFYAVLTAGSSLTP